MRKILITATAIVVGAASLTACVSAPYSPKVEAERQADQRCHQSLTQNGSTFSPSNPTVIVRPAGCDAPQDTMEKMRNSAANGG